MEGLVEQRAFADFPALLREITDPPEIIYLRGTYPSAELKFLAVVGSRKYTSYGKSACEKLIGGLRGHPVCIVSGLALGIDAIAHEAALAAGLSTVAIPGSGLSDAVLYPRTNFNLAQRILKAGGALLSEFPPEHRARPENFLQRNRIMAGLSHAVLVIEAGFRSGTLVTARLAAEYNRDVLTVPGSIFSETSRGNHYLLRVGATPVTSSEEILDALHILPQTTPSESYEIPADCSEGEREILLLLKSPTEKEVLLGQLSFDVVTASSLFSLLEIKGYIKESGGKVMRV